MADELNVPTHRWYEPRNNIALPPNAVSPKYILANGVAMIDAWINSQPWGMPLYLFAANEPGWLYDNSDMSTLFQDSAGTTPVTDVGQPVGKQLDKSGRNNHRTQSTAASRPTFARLPVTGRRNLLTYTDPDASLPTGWAAFNAQGTNSRTLVSAFGEVATRYPSHNAIRFQTTTGRAGISQVISVTSGVLYTLSCYIAPGGVSTGDGAEIVLWAYGASTGVSATKTISNADANGRLTLSFTPSANGTVDVIYGAGAGASVTADVTMTAPQLELGSTATNYQSVVSIYDITEAGVQTAYGLYYDGVDDFLVTPTITPGTDKVQVFAGVRKLSDATVGIVAELSTDQTTKAGSFVVAAPLNNATANYGFCARGSAAQIFASSSGFAAPITNVLTGLGDISGDSTLLRVNGVQVGQSTADRGTGNFLAYPAYFGRRGGTTLPFSGYTFREIGRFGPNLDAATLANVENWINQATGAY